jgi:BolA protein
MNVKRFLGNAIRQKLLKRWREENVFVENDSHLHSRGENSHFRVVVVSDEFLGKGPVERRREVFKCLDEFWKIGVHSISVSAFTLEEFQGKIPGPTGCINKKQ